MVGRAREAWRPQGLGLSRPRLRTAAATDLLQHGLALVFALIAFAGSAAIATNVSDRLPHLADEVAYLFQAQTYAAGHLTLPAPVLSDSFFLPFVLVRNGLWFSKYPPGYPMVLALGALAHASWLVNPLIGALDVGLLYLLGRRLYGPLTALLACALLAASPFFLLQSGSFMSHTVSLFWTLLVVLLVVRSEQDAARRTWSALGAGAALGMLLLTRPMEAAAIALPVGLWLLGGILFGAERKARLLRALALALAAVPFLATLLAYNVYTTGHPLLFAYEIYWPFDTIGFGPGHGLQGHSIGDGLHDTRTKLSELSRYLYGWPLRLSVVPMMIASLASLSELGRAARSRIRRGRVRLDRVAVVDLFLLSTIVVLVALYFAYWGNDAYRGPRYYFAAIGAMALLTARGLERLASGLDRLLDGRLRAPRWAPLAAVLLLATGQTGWSYTHYAPRTFGSYDNYYNINNEGVRQIQAAHLRNAVVFITSNENPYAWPDYVPYYFQNSVALDSNVVYALDLGDGWDSALMSAYPGRSAYRYANHQLLPLGQP